MQIALLFVSNTPLIGKVCNRFSIGVNEYISCLCLSKGVFFPLMQLNFNTYANSKIESSFTLMKFMEVLMNVYLRYSFNC